MRKELIIDTIFFLIFCTFGNCFIYLISSIMIDFILIKNAEEYSTEKRTPFKESNLKF